MKIGVWQKLESGIIIKRALCFICGEIMRHEISMDDKTNHALVLMAKEDGVSGPDFLEKLVLAEDRRRHEETTAGGPRRVRCWLSTCKEPNARTYVDGGGC